MVRCRDTRAVVAAASESVEEAHVAVAFTVRVMAGFMLAACKTLEADDRHFTLRRCKPRCKQVKRQSCVIVLQINRSYP